MRAAKDPCTSCGACCAFYRVDFHRLDLDTAPGGAVPAALTFVLTANLVRLRGTDEYPPRCVALEGVVGEAVRCAIYEKRPGPCRELEPGSDACNRARQRHGLPAIDGCFLSP